MSSRAIAICGAPVVGKSEILSRIAESLRCAEIEEEETWSGERIFCLHVAKQELARARNTTFASWESAVEMLELRLVSGAMFFEEEAICRVLHGVSAICYVAAAEEAGPGREFQVDYFQIYSSLIQKKLPAETPWIWVLNKADLGMANPLEHLISEAQRGEVIPMVAIKGAGIDVLWERVLGVL